MNLGDEVVIFCSTTCEEVTGEIIHIEPGAPGHVHYLICGGEPQSSTNAKVSSEIEEVLSHVGQVGPAI